MTRVTRKKKQRKPLLPKPMEVDEEQARLPQPFAEVYRFQLTSSGVDRCVDYHKAHPAARDTYPLPDAEGIIVCNAQSLITLMDFDILKPRAWRYFFLEEALPMQAYRDAVNGCPIALQMRHNEDRARIEARHELPTDTLPAERLIGLEEVERGMGRRSENFNSRVFMGGHTIYQNSLCFSSQFLNLQWGHDQVADVGTSPIYAEVALRNDRTDESLVILRQEFEREPESGLYRMPPDCRLEYPDVVGVALSHPSVSPGGEWTDVSVQFTNQYGEQLRSPVRGIWELATYPERYKTGKDNPIRLCNGRAVIPSFAAPPGSSSPRRQVVFTFVPAHPLPIGRDGHLEGSMSVTPVGGPNIFGFDKKVVLSPLCIEAYVSVPENMTAHVCELWAAARDGKPFEGDVFVYRSKEERKECKLFDEQASK